MKFKKALFILLICLSIFACSKKEDKEEIIDLNTYSSTELYQLGWNAFTANDFTKAIEYFNALNTREEAYLLGYYGLGWTFLKQYKYNNALNEFNKFFDNDTLQIYLESDSIFIDVKAGLTITKNTFNLFDEVIQESNYIPENWSFKYIPNLDYYDIILLKIIAEYNLELFDNALQSINIIEPDFSTDVSTIEGRLILLNKIELLLNLYG
ncbi:MAG: hypothetical protein PHY08_04415 [Candidatus Cloacimonetes bacterium]|jgi:hypothetical protein|nr:hypothetical protein [Candidatus Cloacimonadota bacterium]MDD4155798.1 hypothetical protein [Candidatus Cloacimonadota bacterium]